MFEPLRQWLLTNLYLLFPSPHSDLIAGILLGVNNFDPLFYEGLKVSGLVHVVVVSGYNVTVVSTMILTLLKQFSRSLRLGVAILIITFYVILTGGSAPAVRAGIMAAITLTAKVFGREAWAVYTLVVAALVMIFVSPDQLGNLSFQLSFAATLGIILFESSIFAFLKVNLPGFLKKDLSASLAASVLVTPLILFNFGSLSLVAPAANMLTLWIVPLITYLGFAILLVSLISLEIASILSWAEYLLTSVFISLSNLFASLPLASIYIQRQNLAVSFGLLLISLGFALFTRKNYYGIIKEDKSSKTNDKKFN